MDVIKKGVNRLVLKMIDSSISILIKLNPNANTLTQINIPVLIVYCKCIFNIFSEIVLVTDLVGTCWSLDRQTELASASNQHAVDLFKITVLP